jgi:hypothetical protein
VGLSAIFPFMQGYPFQGSDSTPPSQYVKKRPFYGFCMPRVPILWKTSSMPLQRQFRGHSGDVSILGPDRKTQKGHFWKNRGVWVEFYLVWEFWGGWPWLEEQNLFSLSRKSLSISGANRTFRLVLPIPISSGS